MSQEDYVTEDHVIKDHILVAEFTSKDWNNNASFSMLIFFAFSVVFGVLGVIVALILMIFLPDMRSLSAVALFSAAFGIIFGFILEKAELSGGRIFLSDFSTKINIILAELAGNKLQNISPSQLKELIDSGQDHPLTVDGVTGLNLRIRDDRSIPTPLSPALTATATIAMEPQQIGKSRPSSKRWQIMIAAEAPHYGTESFDRLLEATTLTGRTEQ